MFGMSQWMFIIERYKNILNLHDNLVVVKSSY